VATEVLHVLYFEKNVKGIFSLIIHLKEGNEGICCSTTSGNLVRLHLGLNSMGRIISFQTI
jgi:hypothetical protein